VEDLRPPEQEPQPTTELEIRFDQDEDDDERWLEREPRLAAARESLSATRASVGESLAITRGSLSERASKVGRWLHSIDRRPEFDAGRDPVAELGGDPQSRGEPPAPGGDADRPSDRDDGEREDDGIEIGIRFPTAALGYNRQAVDDHIALLEEEIAELREEAAPPMSISEEIERLGEQTASILVVAHDKAHETARRAQQQAARAVSEAAANAERLTAEAERRLRELDEETDSVWQERERLLEDVREVSRTLATLADAATERFPAAPESSAPAVAH
jgi:DNA repair exonuclease SbcCD ATPase subunit